MSKILEKLVNVEHAQLVKERAERVAEDILYTQRLYLDAAKNDLRRTNSALAELLDLAPSSKDSLNPVSEGFNPETFVKEIHALELQKIRLEEAIEVLEKTTKMLN